MDITKEQQELIEKFVSESLTNDEAKIFREEYEKNEVFAKAAYEQAFVGASYESILSHVSTNKSSNTKKVKHINFWKVAVAASIVLLVAMGIQLKSIINKAPQVIVETDTLFLPKSEYFILPNALAPVQYAQNTNMEKLVKQTNVAMRSGSDEICLPKNESIFKLGEKVDIKLSQFKPDNYHLTILGFHEQITAIDTVCNKIISISEHNKLAYSYTPLIAGTYYWMVYFNKQPDPYLVRKFYVTGVPTTSSR